MNIKSVNLATQPKPTAADNDDMGSSDCFFIPAFNDPKASEQLLGPMPSAVSKQPKAPRGMPAYLASLWCCPLLSVEQEYHCFRKLNYLKYQSSHLDRFAKSCIGCDQMLSDKKGYDEQSLRVRNQIVQSNLRLVVSLAKKYARYGSNEFDELVGVGNAALLRAVDLFDFRRTTRFSTYAYRAIQ